MSGFIVVLAFLALFVLGFPVVLAIGIPCASTCSQTTCRSS
jgi:hypothetical protein